MIRSSNINSNTLAGLHLMLFTMQVRAMKGFIKLQLAHPDRFSSCNAADALQRSLPAGVKQQVPGSTCNGGSSIC
jgi:hypothetical protein